jgi:hypothetical protein
VASQVFSECHTDYLVLVSRGLIESAVASGEKKQKDEGRKAGSWWLEGWKDKASSVTRLKITCSTN